MALERLVGLAVDETDDAVGVDRFADLGRARLVDRDRRGRFDIGRRSAGDEAGHRAMDAGDQCRKIGDWNRIIDT